MYKYDESNDIDPVFPTYEVEVGAFPSFIVLLRIFCKPETELMGCMPM
jgi:hypothetical protein